MAELGEEDGLRDIEREFVKLLYERSGGDTWAAIAGGQIGDELMLSRLRTGGLVQGLAALGWLRPAVRPQAWPLIVRITPLGIYAATGA